MVRGGHENGGEPCSPPTVTPPVRTRCVVDEGGDEEMYSAVSVARVQLHFEDTSIIKTM